MDDESVSITGEQFASGILAALLELESPPKRWWLGWMAGRLGAVHAYAYLVEQGYKMAFAGDYETVSRIWVQGLVGAPPIYNIKTQAYNLVDKPENRLGDKMGDLPGEIDHWKEAAKEFALAYLCHFPPPEMSQAKHRHRR